MKTATTKQCYPVECNAPVERSKAFTCFNFGPWSIVSSSDAEGLASLYGWMLKDNIWYCPNCIKRLGIKNEA